MEILFFFIVFFSLYSYFLYPVILKLIPEREILDTASIELKQLPCISLIITAHNEESRIERKIRNTLDLDYPESLLEIIVASDFSTDNTDSIVESYCDKGVRLVRADKRRGKEYAQLCAINESRGDIIVFSDVATQIEPNALHILISYFKDPAVGAVSSEDRFISQDGAIVGEGAYVKYEMWLRRLESKRAGLVGLSGSFFAARKEVCKIWDDTVPSDFNTALNCTKLNLIAVSAPDVIGVYTDVKDPSLEYRRKTRTVIRGISAISKHPEVLNIFTMGKFSYQVWSHKIMRWAEPWFLLALIILSLVLFNKHWIYSLALVLQIIFYGLAIIGYFSKSLQCFTIIKIPYFFVQVNLAIAHASFQYLIGKRITVWEPSKR